MINSKIINYFFKKAEIGDWEKINLLEIEKKFNLQNHSLVNLLSDKIFFLKNYDRYIDAKVLKSVPQEDFKESPPEEIIQEYLMNKLDFMNKNKFAISNIINFYLNNPKFFLISLKSTQTSIKSYINQFSTTNCDIQKKLLEKSLIILFLLAYKKWLYEDNSNNSSFALMDKGIKRIKNSTNLFDKALKSNI